MHLKAGNTESHLDLGIGELFCQLEIVFLIETGQQFNVDGNLFTVARRINQRFNHPRVGCHPVNIDADILHRRIKRRLTHKFSEVIEAMIGVAEQYITGIQRLKHVAV